jgi:hypothetical protein
MLAVLYVLFAFFKEPQHHPSEEKKKERIIQQVHAGTLEFWT